MNRLTKRIRGYAHGAEGRSKETLTGNYCRGCFESTACVEKLAEYEDLEEQGKLLKLPCAVGDTIFRINKGAKIPIISMEVHEISMFYSRTNNFVIQIKCHDDIDGGEIFYSDSEIGKTVFLTKSAAEQALKEMEGKK